MVKKEEKEPLYSYSFFFNSEIELNQLLDLFKTFNKNIKEENQRLVYIMTSKIINPYKRVAWAKNKENVLIASNRTNRNETFQYFLDNCILCLAFENGLLKRLEEPIKWKQYSI